MKPVNAMKTRLPISQMKEVILDFCQEETTIEIAKTSGTNFPIIEKANYKYVNGKHIMLLVPVSRLLNEIKDGDEVSGLIFQQGGVGLKSTKRVYGNYICKEMSTDDEFLIEAVKGDKTYTKMLNHGAKFFQLELVSGKVYFSGNEIFDLDENYNPTFAKFSMTGKERFEHSRKLLMEYTDREVIFNVIVEDGVYYTLTSATSNKVDYIKNGGICNFFDGVENTFSSKVEILADSKVEEIFNKLKATNNGFFKTTDNLLALSFSK